MTGVPGNMGQDHVGFVVPDAKAAAEWLIDLFDCEFDWDVLREPTPTAGERGWATIFDLHPDTALRHCIMLKCGDHFLTQYVEIFQFDAPDQVVPEGGWPKFVDVGFSYISFTVKDVVAVLDHIKQVAPSVRIIQDPPMDFPLRHEVCKSTFIVSPWGMWIELTQWSQSGAHGRVMRSSSLPDEPYDEALVEVPLLYTDVMRYNTNVTGAQIEDHSCHPDVGKGVMELDTPAFVVDMDAFERNIALLTSRINAKGIDWRPPVKAHKCPGLTRELLKHGAKGVLVLKLSEAEAFAEEGFTDIMIANEIIDSRKIEKLVQLAGRVERLRVNVDWEENVREIAAAAREVNTVVEMLVEINVGHNRCGVYADEALELAKVVVEEASKGGVRFAGIAGYEGHTPVLPPAEKTAETEVCHSKLAEAKRLIEEGGIEVQVVTGGGSSNYMDVLANGVVTELQAGGAVFTDVLYKEKAGLGAHGHDHAAFVLTQIMSVPKARERAMADAGMKSLGWHPFGGLPHVFGRDDLEVYGLSAEHAKVRPGTNLERGDKLLLVPGYIDAMGLLHRQIHAVRHGVVQDVWPIVGAGHSQ